MEDGECQLCGRWVILLFLLVPFSTFATPMSAYEADMLTERILTFADDEVKERLQSLDEQLVEHRFDESVRYIIRKYVVKWRGGSERILGRAAIFFPIFEKHLAEAGLPDALKYLAITESALRTRAVSRVGAQGLWQFMPSTAQEYGLRINDDCDERLDPNQATLAAIAYLQTHYGYFDDWALTLAAYNAGRGGVQRAMRRSRRSTFWGIKRYLPRETRGYVPGFIAATYLFEFFQHHGLEPDLPSLDAQLTESILLDEACSFYRVAQVTGLSIETIEQLNPGYERGFIPASARGHYLILPKRVAPAFRDYLTLGEGHAEDMPLPTFAPFLPQTQVEDEVDVHTEYEKITYTIQEGDSLTYIAQQLGLSEVHLRLWNGIGGLDSLVAGETLAYYQPAHYRQFLREVPPPVDVRIPVVAIQEEMFSPKGAASLPAQSGRILYYVEKPRKPSQIATQTELAHTHQLLSWNNLPDDKRLPKGSIVVIDRLR